MVDVRDSKSRGEIRVGSSPTTGTKQKRLELQGFERFTTSEA